ncbi:hypothetical protein ACFL0F_01745 [Patescibacteria group bacterium]
MTKYLSFIIHWLFNSAIIYLISRLLPLNVVLGNFWLNSFLAALMTGILLTFLAHIKKELFKVVGINIKGRFINFIIYFAINTFGIWILARIPNVSGIGISTYYYAIGVGFILNVFQWGVRQGLKSVSL